MKIKSFDKTEFSYKSIKYAMKNLKCLRKNFIKYYKNIAPNDLKSFSVISDSYPAIMRKTTELLGGERSISLLFRRENSMPVFAWEIFQKSVEKKEISIFVLYLGLKIKWIFLIILGLDTMENLNI